MWLLATTFVRRGSRVSPWILTALLLMAVAHAGGASWREVGTYAGYLPLCVTLPGILGWRLLWTGAAESWLDQIVFGTLLGSCLQLPLYLIGLVLGMPRLAAGLPVLMLAIVLARRDRRELLTPRLEPIPRVLAWAIAVATAHCVAWVGGIGWLLWRYSRTAPAFPNGDEPYQVAIIAELKHHFPAQLPIVANQPLDYHWFVNAHLAAASWSTGLEPAVLLDRLWLLPTLFLVVAATGLIAYRITRSPWCGAMAVAILALIGNFSPFPSRTAISAFDELFLSFWDPLSPSLNFGAVQLLLTVRVLFHILRTARPGPRDFVLLGICCAMVTGAKATGIPIFLAGLVGAAIVQRLLTGRLSRRLVGALGIAVAAFLFAQFILYGGASQGIRVEPFHLANYPAGKLGLGRTPAAILLLVSWFCAWVGAPLLLRRSTRSDPRAAFLIAAGCAGVIATLLLGHPHYSQDYFVRASVPLLAVAAAWGLWATTSQLMPIPRRRTIGIGVGTGLAAAYIARLFAPGLPLAHGDGPAWVAPYLVTGAVIGGGALSTYLLVKRSPRTRLAPGIVVLVAITSLGLPRTFDTAVAVAGQPWQNLAPIYRQSAPVGLGGLAAARWLRRNSDPDALVATNAHYRQPRNRTDNRHFWIAAYAERRVLVEGWGYTQPTNATASRQGVKSYGIAFWDSALLRVNDAAFIRPTSSTVATLRTRYGVRWLFVDTRYPVKLTTLQRFAVLRFRSGDYAVLELTH